MFPQRICFNADAALRGENCILLRRKVGIKMTALRGTWNGVRKGRACFSGSVGVGWTSPSMGKVFLSLPLPSPKPHDQEAS